MAPVVMELQKHPNEFRSIVCVTAQHREMLDDVLSLFSIEPNYDLDVMQDAQSPAYVAAKVLDRLEPIFATEKPDWVLVQGDTTTTMAAALGAFYNRVRVGHIEAGLRTRNRLQPYPEEINRRVASVVTDLHFVPTQRARDNLLNEGVAADDIILTGNTVIDALLEITSREVAPSSEDARPWDHTKSPIILVTAHRRESFGEPIREICRAIAKIASDNDVHVVYPVHPNPNVRGPAYEELSSLRNVTLTDPLDYLTLAQLMKRSHLILTDSGGIQEEAPSLGVPVLVMREVTERPEAIEAGVAKIVGTHSEDIVREAQRLLDDPEKHRIMAKAVNPFGDGHASERIVLALRERSVKA